MTTINLSVAIDLEEAFREVFESAALSDVAGAQYKLADFKLRSEGGYNYDVEVSVDHVNGRFVTKNDIAVALAEAIQARSLDLTVDVQGVEQS